MRYGDQYPRCADCPKLNRIQQVRDKTSAELERDSIDFSLEVVEIRFMGERALNQMQDQLNNLSEYGFVNGDEYYDRVASEQSAFQAHTSDTYEFLERTQKTIIDTSKGLIDAVDIGASYIATHCDGYRDDACQTRSDTNRVIELQSPVFTEE